MYALLTILVAVLFSFWVWTLKHQQEHVHRHALPTGTVDSHEPTCQEPVQNSQRLSPGPTASHYPPGFDGRNTNGVPVWTIDG